MYLGCEYSHCEKAKTKVTDDDGQNKPEISVMDWGISHQQRVSHPQRVNNGEAFRSNLDLCPLRSREGNTPRSDGLF